MNEFQYFRKLLEVSSSYDIEKSGEPDLIKTHTPYEGTPKKHPIDDNILILLTSPFTSNKKFFEFPISSIGSVEDLGTITSESGETAHKIKVWVKKGMPGLVAEPFIVE